MHSAANVLYCVVYNLMRVLRLKAVVRHQGIAVQSGTSLHMLFHDGLKSFLFAVWYDYRSYFAVCAFALVATFKNAHDSGLSTGPLPVIRRFLTSMCMFRAFPPMNVSSTSHSPANFKNEPVCMAMRIRCIMNQADFCVIPRSRATSQELMPFLQFAISQMAAIHLSSGNGESSKMVPTLIENWRKG